MHENRVFPGKPCTSKDDTMYKKNRNHRFSFTDFNQPLGFKMNPDNRWVRKAEFIFCYGKETSKIKEYACVEFVI